jgi:hypothetical protein
MNTLTPIGVPVRSRDNVQITDPLVTVKQVSLVSVYFHEFNSQIFLYKIFLDLLVTLKFHN